MKSELPKPAKAWIEAINNADLGRLIALMAADHTFYVEGEAPTVGREDNRAAWQGYFKAFPEYRIYVDRTVNNGDNRWYVLGHTSGSHVADHLESQPESVIWALTLQDSLVSRWIIYDGERRAALGIEAKSS